MRRYILFIVATLTIVIFLGLRSPSSNFIAHPVEILALDFLNTSNYTKANILDGDAGIICLENPGNHRIVNDYDLVQNFSALGLDTNHDGKIDTNDARYHQINLLIFSKNGTQKQFIPILKTGVRIIYLYNDYLHSIKHNSHDSASEKHKIVGYAVLADGSKRAIYSARIAQHYFEDIETVHDNQH